MAIQIIRNEAGNLRITFQGSSNPTVLERLFKWRG